MNATDDWRVRMDNDRAAAIPVTEQCLKCDGTGNEFLFMYRKCSDCKGTGRKISESVNIAP